MYTEIIFKHTDSRPIYPDMARKIVAAACDGIEMNPAFFNRKEDGKTISTAYDDGSGKSCGLPPLIIFDGGMGFIRIYGIGKAGSELLSQEAPKVFGALYKKGFISFDQKAGEMDIEYQGFDSMYVLRNIIVARDPKQCQKYIKAPLTGDVALAAQDVFLRGMTGFARFLDEERMEAGLPLKFEQALPRCLTFLEGKPMPVAVNPGNLFAAYKDVIVSMPCKLNGPWATGILRSRGYGLIRRFNPTKGVA